MPDATSNHETAAANPVRPRTTLRIACEFVGVYVIARLILVGGPGAFPGAGKILVGPGKPDELKVIAGTGYDGQFVYRLALDPFTRAVTAHGITLDSPGYRQQRILTSLLAHVLTAVPGIGTALAIVLVNTAAVIVAIIVGVQLAQDLGSKPAWGAVLALPACIPASLSVDLTEPVAWAGVLLALLAIQRRRWAWAAAAFTAAVLARETSAIVLFGFVVESVIVLSRRRDRDELRRLWLALPIVVASAWQVWLWHVWGSIPALSGFGTTGLGTAQAGATQRSTEGTSPIPIWGIAKTFLYGLTTGDTSDPARGVTYLVERIVIIALIGVAAWALATRRVKPGTAITVAWTVAAVLAVSIRGWLVDAQFLRATLEVWGLSVLVIMQLRSRLATVVLVAGGATTLLVTVTFVATV